MRLEREGMVVVGQGDYIAVCRDGDIVTIPPDDLRWLCLVAGPALLNELAKGEGDES